MEHKHTLFELSNRLEAVERKVNKAKKNHQLLYQDLGMSLQTITETMANHLIKLKWFLSHYLSSTFSSILTPNKTVNSPFLVWK